MCVGRRPLSPRPYVGDGGFDLVSPAGQSASSGGGAVVRSFCGCARLGACGAARAAVSGSVGVLWWGAVTVRARLLEIAAESVDLWEVSGSAGRAVDAASSVGPPPRRTRHVAFSKTASPAMLCSSSPRFTAFPPRLPHVWPQQLTRS